MSGFSKNLVFAAMLLASSHAASAFELGAYGGLNFEGSALSPATNPLSAKSSLALGATVGMDMVPMLISIETGLYMVERKMGGALPLGVSLTAGVDPTTYSLSYNALEIPLIARFKPIPFLSPGIGVFYSWDTSKQTTEYTNPAGNQVKSENPVSRTDYGLIGSVQARMPLVPLLSLTVDARYLIGLKDNGYDNANTLKLREFQLLGGLTFSL
ncbi:MAG: porin family protein [Oligoflexia bacterium]|nr:porin family protein [Oligoflexia bacterium]